MLPVSKLMGPVRALFCDLDGTLTTDGVVMPSTYAALVQLGEAGIPIVIVTGRPAGWGQAIITVVPVAGVVAENGGVTFVRRKGKVEKKYGVAEATLPEWRRRMREAAVDVMNEIGGLRMSSDSRYREVDLAIDWNEAVHTGPEVADQAVSMLRARGFSAVRSSVHVNFGPPDFDKLTACKGLISELFEGDVNDLGAYVFVGDAPNDASMFGAFPKSVGVANVRDWWEELAAKPAYGTTQREGRGAEELVSHLLTIGVGNS